MGMPLEMQTLIVTNGKEKRLQDNTFELIKEGYRLYPMHIPIEVRRKKESEPSGTAVIDSLKWEDKKTVIIYRLETLYSVN
ncbi:MAG TPA: DUF2584 domain-containing protein [Bacillus sp. (in: firmicutes)]|uniref:DUF2584 domain-containing protein n=1 Tax=Bacillus litorisediminis TaxID=2922713 RepID=UPI001FAB5456|nr:DUF2584 domain-containing protein [Bacillus litorisediminis]HWO75697.1 DUF2584 domain-containing protein [Bacillus sp. (in: firmicutes)]